MTAGRRAGIAWMTDGTMAAVALRLLVVEDDDHIRTALRWALEDEGYTVEEAVSGEDACRQVAVAPPDLMVLDLMLGRMDGFDVVREVRRAHDLPIIVVSARADTQNIVAALEAGADDYVTKPFQVKEITARLRALRRRVAPGAAPDAVVTEPARRRRARSRAVISLTSNGLVT